MSEVIKTFYDIVIECTYDFLYDVIVIGCYGIILGVLSFRAKFMILLLL